MTKISTTKILKTLQTNNECQYNISFSFKIKKNQTNTINSKIDLLVSDLIPRPSTIEVYDGILFNIVWIQEIQNHDNYYYLDKQYISDEDIICHVTVLGKLHKINSGYNTQTLKSNNFSSLP